MGWCKWGVDSGIGPGCEGWGGIMSILVVSLDSLCRWQVQVSVYFDRRIPTHLRCTQCSIMVHLIDICFLSCICLWQISQIHTCVCVVVGPGFVSTPAFMRSSASHPSDPHGRFVKINCTSGHHCWGSEVSTKLAQ